MPEERLQKILARAGVASRRKAEQMILEGRVTVNGKVVTELGSKADLARDRIEADGALLKAPRHNLYLALYKPKMYMTTTHDPQGRPTVMDLLPPMKERVFPVGRLDYHSEGLLLMTNDGELAAKILAAKSRVPKTYRVKVNGPLTRQQIEEFRAGVPLEGRRTAPAKLFVIRRADNPWYEITLIEGRTNQIRMMFKHFGRLVEKLKRVKVGPISLRGLTPGDFRELAPGEVGALRAALYSDRGSDGKHKRASSRR
jgi:23S rRNA pseudouridine2605 synthase